MSLNIAGAVLPAGIVASPTLSGSAQIGVLGGALLVGMLVALRVQGRRELRG